MSDLLADMLAMKAKIESERTTPRIYGVRCHPADVAAIRQAAIPTPADPYGMWTRGLPYLTSTQVRRGWPQVAYTAEVWRRWQEEANQG